MSSPSHDIIDIYRRHAPVYDQLRSRTLFEKAWLDRFLAAIPFRPRVLDLGCGSGEPIAAYLIGAGCAVTGVDASPGLLDLARSRFPDHSWLQCDMRHFHPGKLPEGESSEFQGALAWDSFFHLTPDDQRAMFGIFRDQVAPGGALMFTSGPEAGVRIGCFEGEPLYHASLAESEYRALLAAHGFDVLLHCAEDPDCNGHTVWLASRRHAKEFENG